MDYIIKNDYLTAVISSKGAELRGLIDRDGINRMHTPSSKTWNRVSPILFPQVSRMPNLKYQVQDQIYHMPAHGFLRDSELEVIEISNTKITFGYLSNEKSLEMYPYNFVFLVTYRLEVNVLYVEFMIKNTGNDVMRYMLGGHPGFKVPLYDDEKYTDYKVVLANKETCPRMCVVDGFLANVYQEYLNNSDSIDLAHNLFTEDALIFKGLQSSYIDLVSKNHHKKIRFHFADFEILAIWSLTDENANFVCLEPWNGIQKDFVIEHEKMGVLELASGKTAYHHFLIEVID